MKCISKKILIYLLCAFLSVTTLTMAYDRGVHAIEWVGGALAFEEALKWAMVLLGVTASTGMTQAYWEDYSDEFLDYAIENGSTQLEVANWKLKLSEGILDKASSVWINFKSWVSNLFISNDGDISSGVSNSLSDTISLYNGFIGNYSIDNSIFLNNSKVYASCLWKLNNLFIIDCFLVSGNYSFNSNNLVSCDDITQLNYLELHCLASSGSNWYIGKQTTLGANSCRYTRFDFNNDIVYTVCSGFTDINLGSYDRYYLDNVGSLDNEYFNKLDNVDFNNLDVISTTDTDIYNPEVSLNLPGQIAGDNEISRVAYDNIIDRINSGEISLEDGIIEAQDIMDVLVYDTDNDVVFPTPLDSTPIVKDDAIEDIRENFGFTLGGLENVFPFCIPWDIYAFLSILEASPTAPVFQFPFRDPKSHQDILYTVDLSPYEPVAVVIRYGFDMVFIVGLGLVTRSLIGAGGDG